MSRLTNEFEESNILEHGTHDGVEYVIAMGPMSINGYIDVGDEHPWSELEYDDVEVEVHGGLTWGGYGKFGFDTAHSGDAYHPDAPMHKKMRDKGVPATVFPGDIVRDEAYVKNEVLDLIRQAVNA